MAGLEGIATDVHLVEAGDFRPIAWGVALAHHLHTDATIVVPGSADGRGLAPHLAHRLARPLLTSATFVAEGSAVVVDGDSEFDVAFESAVVVMIPGVRSVEPTEGEQVLTEVAYTPPVSNDAQFAEMLAADPATLDLATATRIVAGGARLAHVENLELLREAGLTFGASLGATACSPTPDGSNTPARSGRRGWRSTPTSMWPSASLVPCST
ncbi:MAG: hypothetical protein R2706_14025 [Acidimicrobiales bacterium]